MKYELGTTWNINICIDGASDIRKAELEKEIQEFITDLCNFQYSELRINMVNGNKQYIIDYTDKI